MNSQLVQNLPVRRTMRNTVLPAYLPETTAGEDLKPPQELEIETHLAEAESMITA